MLSIVRTLVLVLVVTTPGIALAQRHRPQPQPPPPTPQQTPPPNGHEGDDAAARLLYERGAEAYAAGDYATALDRFNQAYGLSHRPQLLYNVGTTLDRLRRDREALAAFRQFLAEVPEHPRRAEVESRARVLGETIAEEDRQAAEAEERARQEREANEAARRQAEEEAERSRLAREAAERRAEEAGGGMPPAVVFSVGGAAVAASVVGVIFGVQARNRNEHYGDLVSLYSNDADGPIVDSGQYDEVRTARNDAQTSQTLANVCLFGSAALAAGAVTLVFFTDWGGSSESPPTARTVPIVTAGPNGGFLGVRHSF